MSGSALNTVQPTSPERSTPANQDQDQGLVSLAKVSGPTAARGDLLTKANDWVAGLGTATLFGAKRVDPLCREQRHPTLESSFNIRHSAALEMQVTGEV